MLKRDSDNPLDLPPITSESVGRLLSENAKGLKCPRCECRHFWTVTTEPHRNGMIRRYKACRHCGTRIVTWEEQEPW